MAKKSLCTFDGDSLTTLRDLLNRPEYTEPGARLVFLKDGKDYFMRLQDADGEDPGDINASHPCPGSPGC